MKSSPELQLSCTFRSLRSLLSAMLLSWSLHTDRCTWWQNAAPACALCTSLQSVFISHLIPPDLGHTSHYQHVDKPVGSERFSEVPKNPTTHQRSNGNKIQYSELQLRLHSMIPNSAIIFDCSSYQKNFYHLQPATEGTLIGEFICEFQVQSWWELWMNWHEVIILQVQGQLSLKTLSISSVGILIQQPITAF